MPPKTSPAWRFRVLAPSQKHVGPTHREHLATGGVVEPLVREAIQNSLDATAEGKPTKVALTLGEVDSTLAAPFLASLGPHLRATAHILPDGLPDPLAPIQFLAVEDFNTRGLEGDFRLHEETHADGSKNHFFRFWHLIGQYTGEVKRRGSWGVGKVVFANASRIRTFFGATKRAGDAAPLLMGEAGLTIHKLPDSPAAYDWYGYYANHERVEGEYVPMPISDPESLAAFRKAFKIVRAAPGLSILVPYIREDVDVNALAQAVIDNYFLAIVAGRLEVNIHVAGQAVRLEQSTIDEAVAEIEWSGGAKRRAEVKSLLELARWQNGLAEKQYTVLNPVGLGIGYQLSNASFPQNELERLSSEFAQRNPVAIKIPVQVRAKGGSRETENARLILQRDETLRKADVPHLRSGINISNLRGLGSGVRGLLIIGRDSDPQGQLDKLLQASEGPAHLNWETRGEGFDKAKALFEDAYKALVFMRNVVPAVCNLLASPSDDRDTKTLAPFFPDFEAIGLASGKSLGRKTETIPPSGVVQGIVEAVSFSQGKLVPVERAAVDVIPEAGEKSGPLKSMLTDGKGEFRFDSLSDGNYRIVAKKEDVGEAQKSVELAADCGIHVRLILRKPAPRKPYRSLPLDDGFRIEGNAEYSGQLKPITVELAYAAWGGSKSFRELDFSLYDDDAIAITWGGLREAARPEMIVAPNKLRVSPVAKDFHLEVRGFDRHRALHVDARTTDEAAGEEEKEE